MTISLLYRISWFEILVGGGWLAPWLAPNIVVGWHRLKIKFLDVLDDSGPWLMVTRSEVERLPLNVKDFEENKQGCL